MSGKVFQPPLDLPFLVECIREKYHAQVTSLHRLKSDSGKYIYRTKLANGAHWILRVVEEPDKTNLVEFADFLLFFEQQDYPAERIVFTAEQATVVAVGGWHLLMTTFLAGTPLEYAPATFSLLGASVGRLHALKPSLTFVPRQARMLPSDELAFAQQQLNVVVSRIPQQYVAQYDWLEKAILAIDRGTHLPTTLIHNDCHPGNALLTAPGQVVLLDWDEAGVGPAVLDVAFLLENCDGKAPWDIQSNDAFHPDEAFLYAAIEGYCRYHQLTTNELDYLADALRFRSLVYGACSFASAIAQEKNAEFSEWWYQRYGVAEEMAERARGYFERKV